MPCFTPLEAGRPRGSSDKPTIWQQGKRPTPLAADWEPLALPCGSCIGCRIDYSKMWAMRIVHESTLQEDNCFLTLTYRDKSQCTAEQLAKGQYKPEDNSLNKTHIQKFFKRLRKHFSDTRIKYYQCGEYGDQDNRPHHHAALFNLRFSDEELFSQQDGNYLFTSQTLEDIWGYGFCTIGELTLESAQYIARYVTKKITGKKAQDHYLRYDQYGNQYWIEPEYSTMSRRPGIGREWYEKYKDDIWPADEVPVPGSGVYKKVPKYYETILANDDPGTLEEIRKVRQIFFENNKHEYTPARLKDKHDVFKAKINMLKREMI